MGGNHVLSRDKKARKKWARQTWAMGEKHARPRDEKARKSEQAKHWQRGKSTHNLDARRQAKVSKTNMGDGGKARTS